MRCAVATMSLLICVCAARGHWVCEPLQHERVCEDATRAPPAPPHSAASFGLGSDGARRGQTVVMLDPPGGVGSVICQAAKQNHRVVDPEEARACRVYGEHTRADMLGNGSFLKDFLAEHSYIDFAVSSYPLAWRDAYHPSGDPIAGRQAAYIVVMRDPVRRIAEQYIEWGNQVSPFPPQPAPPPAPPHPGRLDFSGGGFTGRAKRQAPFNAHHFYKRQSSLSTAARFVEWLRTQPDNLMVRLLCGWFCAHVGRGQLERKHFDAATIRLQSFSVVTVISRAAESAEQFRNELGWSNLTSPLQQMAQLDAAEDHLTHLFLKRMRLDYEVSQELMGMHLLDVALYRHIEALMAIRTSQYYAQPYAEANRRAGCTMACCENPCMHSTYSNPKLRSYDVGREKAGRLLGAVTQGVIAQGSRELGLTNAELATPVGGLRQRHVETGGKARHSRRLHRPLDGSTYMPREPIPYDP